MKKKIIDTLLLITLLFGLGVYHYSNYSGLWKFRQDNKEMYRLLKRGYLKIVPIQELEASGMGIKEHEETALELDQFFYFQGELDTYNELGEGYNWEADSKSIIINYCDERDTLTPIHKKDDGNLYADYEMLGDDGSYARYFVKVY